MLFAKIIRRIAQANQCVFAGIRRLSFTVLHPTRKELLARYEYCFKNCREAEEKQADNISTFCDFTQPAYDPNCFLA